MGVFIFIVSFIFLWVFVGLLLDSAFGGFVVTLMVSVILLIVIGIAVPSGNLQEQNGETSAKIEDVENQLVEAVEHLENAVVLNGIMSEKINHVEKRLDEAVKRTDVDDTRDNIKIVPSNKATIDAYRMSSKQVIYNRVDNTACLDDECFRVQLVQHDDGTFWACRRNYGACYPYEI